MAYARKTNMEIHDEGVAEGKLIATIRFVEILPIISRPSNVMLIAKSGLHRMNLEQITDELFRIDYIRRQFSNEIYEMYIKDDQTAILALAYHKFYLIFTDKDDAMLFKLGSDLQWSISDNR